MSKTVRVPGLTQENATLLLDAAQSLDLHPSAVRTASLGHFLVDEEVAKKAGVDYESDEVDEDTSAHLVGDDGGEPKASDGDESGDKPKATARKTAAKKTAAKKTTSAAKSKE